MRLVDLVDALIIVILIVLTYGGFCRGFVLSVYDVIVGYLSIIIAFTVYRDVGAALGEWFSLTPTIANAYGFLSILIVLDLARLVGGAIFEGARFRIFPSPGLNDFVEGAGALLVGGLRATYYVVGLIVAINTFSATAAWRGVVDNAPLSRAIQVAWADYVPTTVVGFGGGVSVPTTGASRAPAVGGEPLPITTGSPGHPDPVAQAQLLEMTDLARRQSGLAPFVLDPQLTLVANGHTDDMAKLALLFHDSPTSGSVSDRLRAAGVPFQSCAENVAFARALDSVFSGLMASPEHRRNILSTEFRRIGISVSRTDPSGILITQDFAD